MKYTVFLLWAALAAAPSSRAQGLVGLGMDYPATTAPLINFANMAVMNNNSMNTGASAVERPARMMGRPAVQRNAQELARMFPAASRAKMTQGFEQSMDVYQQVAAKMGWQRDDLEGALAAFIVGNYMVFANREVQDAEFAAVAEQLRRGGGARRLAEKQSAEALRNLYEKSAMVGAFMALAYKSQQQKVQPEHVAANLRNSARENLKRVLGTDPDRLQIGERGVILAR
ncbi:hypothetical protein GM658_28080 [Pseudoduganella eburnea]|uniref:DUF4197 domain-containing protein n=1 Tax=Massilia eburnea TaxID=1776165 RepID=A0A6L6QQ44_9BURK|nr:DUF6683 family protein [Massilia eburnea]MTW14479.1 hypothetical protein [Massilia eburnea]